MLAQVQTGGIPYSFNNNLKSEIPVVNMPKFDINALLEEDKREMKNRPYRFAKVFPMSLSMSNSGVWETTKNGGKVWRLTVKSKNALSIGLVFKNFSLPENSELYIYNSDKSFLLGAVTSLNNNPSNILPTEQIKGDEITIEYYQTKDAKFTPDLIVSDIAHDYRGFYDTKSQSCEVNVNCPEGDEWQDIKHAICKYTFSGYICTGALVANTNNDDTPYFLTANHCVNTQSQANTTVFYFNYEASTCDGTYGPSNQTTSGAMLKATANNHLDFTLLELNAVPPESYEPYYAGWDYSGDIAENTTCIHHPDGDIKKISKDDDSPGTGSFSGYDYAKHWKIFEWDLGTTEGGSSGSPLFDQNQRVIGDLSGGQASCDYNFNDYYQKFSNAWEDYSANNEQLKYWLDPAGIEPGYFDGYNPYGTATSYNPPQNLQASVTGYDVNLVWEAPESSFEPAWQHYAEMDDLTNLNWITPERATLFDDADFDFTYPAQITKVSSGFYEHDSYPWPDATFRFKIYNAAGNSLLYESGDIEAAHLTEIEHELSSPLNVNDNFYVAVVPVDESGHPSSVSVQVASGSTHSYNGSLDDWSIYDDGTDAYEYITGVYIGGVAGKLSYNKSEKPTYKYSEIDYSKIEKIENKGFTFKNTKDFIGYKIYRNDIAVSSTLPVSTLSFTDNVPDGTYTYCVKALYSGGISDCSNEQSVTLDHTDIKNIENDTEIFPNPASDKLNIKFSTSEKYFIQIIDITGKTVLSDKGENSILNYDISDFSKGMYFVNIALQNKTIIRKIIIE